MNKESHFDSKKDLRNHATLKKANPNIGTRPLGHSFDFVFWFPFSLNFVLGFVESFF